MPSVIWQMPRDGSERKRHPAAAEPGHCRLEWPSGIAIFTWSDGQSGERGQYELSLRHLVKRIPERVVAHPRALYAELEQPHRNPHAYPMMLRGRPDMTTSDVVHVITGLEVGGAEMLLLELCREDIRYGRTPSVASLMSDGPMRDRFAKVGVQVIGLGMRRGSWSGPGLLRLVRIIRQKRPRIVQGWLYHGNLAATAATWASGVRPRPRLAWGILGTLPDFTCYPPRLRRAVRVSAKLSPFIDGIFTTAGSRWMPIGNSASVRGERIWFQTVSIWTGFASTRYRARRFAGRWACPTTRSR